MGNRSSRSPIKERHFSSNGFVTRLPKRLILVRHGESLGNCNEAAYSHTPDWMIPLTEEGINQSKQLGKDLREIVGDGPLFIYCSPYIRTKQTLKYIMESFNDSEIIGVREEPRISEQQFGNFQKEESMINFKSARSNFGRFYYRFPEGEAGLDVYNRVTSFIATMFRDWAKLDSTVEDEMTVLIVTHGLTLRLFLMRWFHYTVQEFEDSTNPPNATYVCLNRQDTNDEFSSTQFRFTQESLRLCNLPERIYVYDKSNGRKFLDELIKEVS